MYKRWIASVHPAYCFYDIGEYLEDLSFSKAILQARVHHIYDTTSGTTLHEDEDFISRSSRDRSGRSFYEINDMFVTANEFVS